MNILNNSPVKCLSAQNQITLNVFLQHVCKYCRKVQCTTVLSKQQNQSEFFVLTKSTLYNLTLILIQTDSSEVRVHEQMFKTLIS